MLHGVCNTDCSGRERKSGLISPVVCAASVFISLGLMKLENSWSPTLWGCQRCAQQTVEEEKASIRLRCCLKLVQNRPVKNPYGHSLSFIVFCVECKVLAMLSFHARVHHTENWKHSMWRAHPPKNSEDEMLSTTKGKRETRSQSCMHS